MGYFGKLEEKEIAIQLRKKGFSYKQILKRVDVSKDTISRWCRNITLTPSQMEILLKRKLHGGEKGRIIAAKLKHDTREKETIFLFKKGIKEVGQLSKRDRFVSGISLYAGEGGKTQLEFANSDPKIIKFMMSWFREFCEIPESKFRGAIWIHDNLDPDEAKNFWSKTTGIPRNQFFKTYLAKNKLNSRKIRKNIHQFGVFSIVASDVKVHRKILGWIAGVMENRLL